MKLCLRYFISIPVRVIIFCYLFQALSDEIEYRRSMMTETAKVLSKPLFAIDSGTVNSDYHSNPQYQDGGVSVAYGENMVVSTSMDAIESGKGNGDFHANPLYQDGSLSL